MALSQNLVQKQTQRLVITQDLRQSIELLPLSNLELSDKIQNELMENPFLESGTEGEEPIQPTPVETPRNEKISEQAGDGQDNSYENDNRDDWWRNREESYASRGLDTESTERKHQFLENALSSGENLPEHLLWQLRLTSLNERERRAGELIISAIDNRGYLTETLEDLIRDTNLKLEEAEAALQQIHGFDPLGCGARDIADSLHIQARILRPDDETTHILLRDHLDNLERLDYKKIEKQTGISREEIEESLTFIRTLEPYPGTLHSPRQPGYIVPDIIVAEREGNIEIMINDEWLPALDINEGYKDLLKDKNTDVDREYLQARLNSAVWLIRSISQRRQTLYKVTAAIVEFQKEFFEKGPGNLKPLTLREVAEKVELHESTVSRITTNKYAQTRWGVLELKYFFSSSLKSSTGGESHSARSIQDRIKQLIDEEDPDKPLSDQGVVEKMKEEGVQIARRTVAKYRQLLQILPADRRKKLKKLNGMKK